MHAFLTFSMSTSLTVMFADSQILMPLSAISFPSMVRFSILAVTLDPKPMIFLSTMLEVLVCAETHVMVFPFPSMVIFASVSENRNMSPSPSDEMADMFSSNVILTSPSNRPALFTASSKYAR